MYVNTRLAYMRKMQHYIRHWNCFEMIRPARYWYLKLSVTVLLSGVILLFAAHRTGYVGKDSTIQDRKSSILPEKYKAIAERMEQRKRDVAIACSTKIKEDSTDRNDSYYRHLSVHDGLKLIACSISKVGSTYISRLTSPGHSKRSTFKGKSSDKPTMQSKSRIERKPSLENFLKVIFVRHPFDRLWSAYTSKIMVTRPNFRKFAQNLVKKSRPNATKAEKRCNPPTFKEFVRHLITENNNTIEYNHLWRLYDQICHPCSIEYDFIGNLSFFDEELEYLQYKLGISSSEHKLWTFTNSSVDAMIMAGCRLNRKLMCMNDAGSVERNFQYLAIEGLVDPESDRKTVIPLMETWLKPKNGEGGIKCREKIKYILQKYPESERKSVINKRKDAFRQAAYRTLSGEDLRELRKIYERDFIIFGFDPMIY